MHTIKLWFLGLVSESLDDIIALFEKMDARLDKFIEQERSNQNVLRHEIAKLNDKLIDSEAATVRATRTQTNIKNLVG